MSDSNFNIDEFRRVIDIHAEISLNESKTTLNQAAYAAYLTLRAISAAMKAASSWEQK